jgi:hypothetical protein
VLFFSKKVKTSIRPSNEEGREHQDDRDFVERFKKKHQQTTLCNLTSSYPTDDPKSHSRISGHPSKKKTFSQKGCGMGCCSVLKLKMMGEVHSFMRRLIISFDEGMILLLAGFMMRVIPFSYIILPPL